MSENNIKTVKEYVKYELVEKKSVFIGHIFPVSDAQEAEKKISEISRSNPEARHSVYAYVTGNSEKMSDDGEPQGTGGAPVMSVIKLNGLSNVCIVVTRYFGGILLGAKGLVRAYSSAASGALNSAEIVNFIPFADLKIKCSYSDYEKTSRLIAELEGIVLSTDFVDNVELSFSIPDYNADSFKSRFTNLTNGQETCTEIGKTIRTKK